MVGAEESANDKKWNYGDDYGNYDEGGARQSVFILKKSRTSDAEWKCEEEFWQARNEAEGDGVGAGLDGFGVRSEAFGDTTRDKSGG